MAAILSKTIWRQTFKMFDIQMFPVFECSVFGSPLYKLVNNFARTLVFFEQIVQVSEIFFHNQLFIFSITVFWILKMSMIIHASTITVVVISL